MIPPNRSFKYSFLSKTPPAQVTRLPHSLVLTQQVFRTFTSPQILSIILKDVDYHSKLGSLDLIKKQKIAPQSPQLKKIPRSAITGCNCRKSKCLKHYCDCFAAGNYCEKGCACQDCANTENHQTEREQEMYEGPELQPSSIVQKKKVSQKQRGKGKPKERGCNCTKSSCQKKYCECFAKGKQCTKLCKCQGCLNCQSIKSYSGKIGGVEERV